MQIRRPGRLGNYWLLLALAEVRNRRPGSLSGAKELLENDRADLPSGIRVGNRFRIHGSEGFDMKAACISFLIGGVTTAAVAAGAAAPDAERLLTCYEMKDAGARLQCFDRAVAPLAQPAAARTQPPATVAAPVSPRVTPSVTPQVTPPAAAPAAPAASLPEFGQEQLKLKDQSASSQGSLSLSARIASMRKGGQGIYFITLDNGQVWSHEASAQADYLVIGETVTISRAALGSYRLTRDAGKSKNWIRVNRVR
jgi:hypothetical protein